MRKSRRIRREIARTALLFARIGRGSAADARWRQNVKRMPTMKFCASSPISYSAAAAKFSVK
jgi:hypothetical protein